MMMYLKIWWPDETAASHRSGVKVASGVAEDEGVEEKREGSFGGVPLSDCRSGRWHRRAQGAKAQSARLPAVQEEGKPLARAIKIAPHATVPCQARVRGPWERVAYIFELAHLRDFLG